MNTDQGLDLVLSANGRHEVMRTKIFQSILFPVDFSAACKETAPYVRGLAGVTGGRITLLHVIPARSAWYGAADIYSQAGGDTALQRMKRAQLAALAAFRDQYFDQRCEIRVEYGSIPERIVEFADHAVCDLIMTSTSATTDFSANSTMSQLLNSATCPVWSAPRANRLRAFMGFRSMVCALSPSALSGEYVNETVALRAVFRSRLTFASALTPDRTINEPCRVSTLEEEHPEADLNQLSNGRRCAVYVETGPIGQVVRHIAELQSADLVIVNRRHNRHFGESPFGHSREIILESPCPVLCLPTKTTNTAAHILVDNYRQAMCAIA